jgi:hypothetical protein
MKFTIFYSNFNFFLVGGLGLNLTGADVVIFIEHDWNPMKVFNDKNYSIFLP